MHNVVIDDRGEGKATASRWFNSQGRLGRRAIPFISIDGLAGIQDARSQEVAATGMTLPSRQDQRTPRASGRDGVKGRKGFDCHRRKDQLKRRRERNEENQFEGGEERDGGVRRLNQREGY